MNNLTELINKWQNSAIELREAETLINLLIVDNKRLEKIADKLLDHCDKENGECSVCSGIVCPHNDSFHFHHDGCPSCAEDVAENFKMVSLDHQGYRQ